MPSTSPFDVTLQSERVKLVPFDTSKHTQPFIDAPSDLYDYFLLGPWTSEAEFLSNFYNPFLAASSGASCLFAIYDKTRGDALAGMIGYLNTSFSDLSTEIAFVVILPEFQRTHVTTHAIGLLMQYALNVPSDPHMPGLGLRRLQWRASSANDRSVNAAKRMGFQLEGIIRWAFVLNENNAKQSNGKDVREGDPRGKLLGRDNAMLSVCWDDWEDGVKDLVQAKMDRR